MANVVQLGNVAFPFSSETPRKNGHQLVAYAPEPPGQVGGCQGQFEVKYRQIPLERAGKNLFGDFRSLQSLVAHFRPERPEFRSIGSGIDLDLLPRGR